MAASAPQFQSEWRIPLKPPIELSNINVLKRFRNYCGLIKIARSGFPWEKTTRRSLASVYTNCETAVALRLITAKRRFENDAK